ncbi:MAG: T9SS type A sorting domain-containing protein [Cyclobacteriaceae bacterium]|nr:T9SS type A sorting domain-containing protein [Cyclobacteriaceae bacterium]
MRYRYIISATIMMFLLSLKLMAQPAFFGTNYSGGEEGLGTIFTTDADGNNLQVVFEPKGLNSTPTGKPIEVSPGLFYGLATEGSGNNYRGAIFSYNVTTGEYIERYKFEELTGYSPVGSLVRASNGKLYAMTDEGGDDGNGVLFEYDEVNNTYAKKAEFDFGTVGVHPFNSLLEASNGKLYGLMTNGGSSISGTVIEYDYNTNTLTKKAEFDNTNNGRIPNSNLAEHNGKLYGTTVVGGANDGGTLFSYDLNTSALIGLFDFEVGASPVSTPIVASNGKMYGFTRYAGLNNAGGLWEYDFNSSMLTFKVQLYDYSIGLGIGDLQELSTGKLTGRCEWGGNKGFGGVVEYDFVNDVFVVKAHFSSESSDAYDSFVVGTDNKLYGHMPYGGSTGFGAFFRYDPSSTQISELVNFNVLESGYNPVSLVSTPEGKIYGLNLAGGIYNGGTLFEMNPITYEVEALVQFKPKPVISARTNAASLDFSNPHYLIVGSNGKLYGRTNRGGAGNGVLFSYDPVTDALDKIGDFNSNTGYNGGGGYRSGLIEVDGKLYGVNRIGGTSGDGTLFEFEIASQTFTAVADLGAFDIAEALGNLVLAGNGKLYGTSLNGGTNNKGTIFEYDIDTETVTKKISFNDVSGLNPYGGLIKEADDKLIGVTYSGGVNNQGEAYEYIPSTNTYNTRASFDATSVGGPVGELLMAANGNFYGLGSNSFFELDNTNTVNKKSMLIGGGGSRFHPYTILEICLKPMAEQPDDIQVCGGESFTIDVTTGNTDSYVWKNDGNILTGQSDNDFSVVESALDDGGTYTIELTNQCGTSVLTLDVQIDVIGVDASFNGATIEVTATGGTTPYEYSVDGTDFQTSSSFLLANGQYDITVRDTNGCVGTSTQSVVITSLDEWAGSTESFAYPNPATSVVHLRHVAPKSTVRLITLSGRELLTEESVDDSHSLNIGSLATGIYVVEMVREDGKVMKLRLAKK